MTTLLLADTARTAGVVAFRLLLPLLGIAGIVLGSRLRRDPRRATTATVVLVGGSLLVLLGLAGLATVATQA